jgi:transcriptional regulator with XRE-family HTH domain
LGLTQADVAGELPGMSRSLYAHVEQGRRPLNEDETAALAKVLRVNPATIVRALALGLPPTGGDTRVPADRRKSGGPSRGPAGRR